MKKIALILLSAIMVLSLASCSGTKKDDTTTNADTTATQTEETTKNEETTKSTGTSAPDSSLALLNTVWDSYKEDDKFSVSGGDATEGNMTMNAAGKFGLTDAAAVDSSLGFPAAEIDKIDDAASLMHMMNANTFTCGAFHTKDGTDMAALATAIKTNIMQRQWMCGFPDKLVVVSVDGYLISFFGENETVNTFKTNLTATFSSAEVLCEEAIA